jgi:hypothetical protein
MPENTSELRTSVDEVLTNEESAGLHHALVAKPGWQQRGRRLAWIDNKSIDDKPVNAH